MGKSYVRLKPLPGNWRETVKKIEPYPSNRKFASLFGVSPTIVYRWRRESLEFNRECERILAKPKDLRPEKKALIHHMTPDQIDELLLDLFGEATERNAKQARIAIRQLRKEIRELRSDNNRLRHAEHMRRCSRGLPTHANGGGTKRQAI